MLSGDCKVHREDTYGHHAYEDQVAALTLLELGAGHGGQVVVEVVQGPAHDLREVRGVHRLVAGEVSRLCHALRHDGF